MEQKVEDFSAQLQLAARVAKLLSHPARLMIIEHLAQSCACHTGDLSALLPLSRSTSLQHLEALKKAGWVKGTINGSRINYCLDSDKVQTELGFLAQFVSLKDTLSKNNC